MSHTISNINYDCLTAEKPIHKCYLAIKYVKPFTKTSSVPEFTVKQPTLTSLT